MIFEIVAENLAEVKVAEKFGIKRVELCSALDLGGLTPGPGLAAACSKYCNIEIHAMIRPRGGGFVYTAEEVEIMENDISFFARSGCKGVVFGLLRNDRSLDINNTLRLVKLAKQYGLEVTFHRAIDFSDDMLKSLENIISCGVNRILTAGDASGVDKGMKNLHKLIKASAGRIQIMAGGGVNAGNINKLIELQPDAIHFNIRKLKMPSQISGIGDEYDIDMEKIKAITECL